MSCPGTDWTVLEARLNRWQQATVEKEHDTKSSGIRGRWDLEPVDHDCGATWNGHGRTPQAYGIAAQEAHQRQRAQGEGGAAGARSRGSIIEGQRPLRWPVRVFLGGTSVTFQGYAMTERELDGQLVF